jgi:UDP-glucose 4-epimerase
MKVLIAGGAGFIGSTIASACVDAGITPIVIDNLETGRREYIRDRIFYKGNIADQVLIAKIFEEHSDIHAAILCAALISVPESITHPSEYYDNNVAKCLEFTRALISNDCTRLIFSSSASIYATSDSAPVDENSPLDPQNPYARSKATLEEMLDDISHSGYLRVLSFRYFNPIGADPKMRSGLQSSEPSHALSAMIRAMETGKDFVIMGTDYATRDGTGIRDYIHVWDIAQAHIAALMQFDLMLSDARPYEVINLGTGTGTTVRELLAAFNEVSDVPVGFVDMPRRSGDTAGVYASNAKAKQLLAWTPRLTLFDGIRDSLKWAKIRDEVSKDSSIDQFE